MVGNGGWRTWGKGIRVAAIKLDYTPTLTGPAKKRKPTPKNADDLSSESSGQPFQRPTTSFLCQLPFGLGRRPRRPSGRDRALGAAGSGRTPSDPPPGQATEHSASSGPKGEGLTAHKPQIRAGRRFQPSFRLPPMHGET